MGEVVGEHVEHEAVGAGELQVVEAPGAHLPHQDRPGDHQDEEEEEKEEEEEEKEEGKKKEEEEGKY